jgi:hypothetical protein
MISWTFIRADQLRVHFRVIYSHPLVFVFLLGEFVTTIVLNNAFLTMYHPVVLLLITCFSGMPTA